MSEAPTLSPHDLERLAELIAEKLDARMSGRPRLVDGLEMAEMAGVSLASIERAKAAGRIPYVKLGVRIKYSPDAVLAALTQNAQRPDTAKATER